MTDTAALPLGYSLDDQIACLDREVIMRDRVYRRWVAEGKMKREKADWELGAMMAALATLRALAASPQKTRKPTPEEHDRMMKAMDI